MESSFYLIRDHLLRLWKTFSTLHFCESCAIGKLTFCFLEMQSDCFVSVLMYAYASSRLSHFSIKKGEAEMSILPRTALANGEQDVGSGLVIKPRVETEEAAESTQAVLAFTMKDWKRLCEENYAEGEEGGLPHRTGSSVRSNASQE